MPQLYHFPLDPFSRRMRLALAEYGVACEAIEQKPWEPDAAIYELNPAGTVPIFVEDNGLAVSGIEALTEYLEETRIGKITLIPGKAADRAEVRRLVGWFDTKFYAEVSEPVLTEKIIRRFLKREHGGGAPDIGRVRKALERVKHHLDYVSILVDSRKWLAGDHMSLADLAAAAHLSAVDYLGDVPWNEFKLAKVWYQRIKSRPSFRPLLADSIRGVSAPPAYADLDF
jgi:glutathione S-transferase